MKQVKISCKYILMALLMLSVSAAAQTVYQCDFENAAERANWHLNVGSRGPLCANQWRIGPGGQFGNSGTHGLYINPLNAADTTVATYVGSSSMTVLAYRDLTLPVGQYSIIFDYKCNGGADAFAVVCWIPQTQNVGSSNTNGQLPGWGTTDQLAKLNGTSLWKSASATFNVTNTNTNGRLVVVWVNTQAVPVPCSACIDNICIYEGTACAAPTNFQYNTQTNTLTWSGTGTNYEVRYYNYQDEVVYEVNNITTKSCQVTLTGEGYTYFYVRQVCDATNNVHSAWVSTGTFAYLPGRRCVEFMNFGTDKVNNAGICYVGEHSSSSSHTSLAFETTPRMVDYGYQSSSSMHTLHYDPSETDPNTENMLLTVPTGEIASVRLGAYTGSGQDARIEYKYTVKAGQSDLMDLNYACVLQSGGHSQDNPFFQLDVLDNNGNQIGGCTHEYFVADMTGSGGGKWHQNGDIWWSSRDKVTVSLRNYVGQTLTIRLTSSRCVYDTHYGYAYFTIGCRSGSLEGVTCGDFATDHFTAPEGFSYRWKSADNTTTVLDTARTFSIGIRDTTIYTVDCVSKTNRNCYYTLTANPNPRFPQAIISNVQTKTANCQNTLTLENASGVYVINRQTGLPMASADEETVDDVMLNWGDGSAEETIGSDPVTHVFPNKGGQYTIKCYASMNGGVCVDTAEYVVTFPNIEDAGKQDTVTYHRVGSTAIGLYTGEKYTATDEAIYYDTKTIKNQYGCDVPCTHKIVFRNDIIMPLNATVCQGSSVTFTELYGQEVRNDTALTTAGQYERRHTHTDVMIFDTTFALTLAVQDTIRIAVPDTIAMCGHDEAAFFQVTPEQGNYIGVNVLVGQKGQDAGLNTSYMIENRHAKYDEVQTLRFDMPIGQAIRPDYYPIELEFPVEDGCSVHSKSAILVVKYGADQFLDQKYGFVFLLNADHNYGGFEYDSYTWYRDSVLMPDEHDSYVSVTNADIGHKYYVVVVRRGETTPIPSCEIEYTSVNPLSITNTLGGKSIRAVYDLLGRKQEKMNARGAYIVIYDDGTNEKIIY